MKINKKYILIVGLLIVCTLIACGIVMFNSKKPTEDSTPPPMVSVILPTYNREEYLQIAIESILNQTYKDFELIVINDGSKDGTNKVLKKYMQKDKRVKVINHIINQGLIAGLNHGLDMARGKYIVRMDDDDISYLNRLSKQVDFMEKHPDITIAGSLITPLDSNVPYPFQNEADPDRVKLLLLMGKAPVAHPAIIIRKDFLDKYKIRYRKNYYAAEDRPLYGEVILNGGKMTNIQEPLLHYRVHYTNSQKYYMQQNKNVARFHEEFLHKVIPYQGEVNMEPCIILELLKEYNDSIKYVPNDVLNGTIKEKCIDNPFWRKI